MRSEFVRFCSIPTNSFLNSLGLKGAEDCSLVSGHDFSRAVNAAKSKWALAPAVGFSDRSRCQ
jgi:hypothetical protein